MRGGICFLGQRYAHANNPYLSCYNPSEPPNYIVSLDVNNLYGFCMSEYLPKGDFRWLLPEEIANFNVMTISRSSSPQKFKFSYGEEGDASVSRRWKKRGIALSMQYFFSFVSGSRFITHPQLQADMFADYFASKNAYHEPLPLDFLYDKNNLLNKPFHILELHSAIKNSKNATPGADHVTTIFFKNLDQGQCDVILRYFQKLFDNAIVPDSWKHAIILPIPKPCKDKIKISYRPIALTSDFQKLLREFWLIGFLTI
ncbi:hypothetical protein TNCV_3727941 [Trichonephila clavipes]|uniref:DNA-directed DNA polymerase n=1 Tax=Trichonephila clavipes TaxID=2585209 RepID=A0A8X6R1Q4_TRICX|nr:hypothetical protein TNCV_3727941 [Trichonephila clavipes]